MTRSIQQIGLLIAKDLRIEARSRQTVGLVVVLGILIVVVLGLGLSAQQGGRAWRQPRCSGPPIYSAAFCALRR